MADMGWEDTIWSNLIKIRLNKLTLRSCSFSIGRLHDLLAELMMVYRDTAIRSMMMMNFIIDMVMPFRKQCFEWLMRIYSA